MALLPRFAAVDFCDELALPGTSTV